MKDRFTLGFIAGVIGAIPMNVMNLFNYYVTHLAKLRYLDFAGYLVFGRLPKTLGEVILSQIVQFGFSGTLGVIFAYFLLLVNLKNHWFKGLIWGTGSWFAIYSITVLYKLNAISKPDFTTALMQYISTGIYGVTMALTFVWMEHKAETSGSVQNYHTFRFVSAPAMKQEKKKVRLMKPKKF